MSDSTQNFVEKPEEASKSSSSNLRQRFPSKDFNPSFQCPLDSDEKDDEEVKPSILAAQEHKNKLRSLRIRTLSTLALFFLLILFVYLGHVFLVALLFFIQVLVYSISSSSTLFFG
uniref:Phosphatidate cytidylyltransferase n=1 Tax=Tetraselmis sp. GSL018 TaxID=582737 RepID=A0A061RHW1_9CHLO